MDKFGPFKSDEETIESWLDAFEARLLCHNISNNEAKRNWCSALVGEAGRSIIKKLPPRSTWNQVKHELTEVLGEPNPKERAFDKLLSYRPGNKGLGEIASDVMTKASTATEDIDVQHRLGLKAFLSAIPARLGKELRRKHLRTVKEALEEARFLERVEMEETGKESVLTVEADKRTAPASQEELVEACMKRLEAQTVGRRRRPDQQAKQGNQAKRKLVCWCCNEPGHGISNCPVVSANRAAQEQVNQQGNE